MGHRDWGLGGRVFIFDLPSANLQSAILHSQHDFALGRELDRVADQVHQHLPQPQGIADERVGQFVAQLADQFQALLVGPHAQGLDDLLDGLAEVEGRRFQLEAARLDPGEVEDFVQEFQQQIGRLLGGLQVVADGRTGVPRPGPGRSCP